MLSNLVKLEHAIEGKVYQLFLNADSPLNHVKEALFQFSSYIGKIEEQVKAQQESQTPPASVEPSKVEPMPEPKV